MNEFHDVVRASRKHLRAVMGVDPGVDGGATILDSSGAVLVTLAFRPAWTHSEFNANLRAMVGHLAAVNVGVPYAALNAVALERVGYIGRREDGSKDGGKGAFTFGRVDGIIRGTLLSCNFRPNEVLPMHWQQELGCLTGGDKNVSKRRAKCFWPSVDWTHNTADSALIAEWLRRRNTRWA